MPCISNISGYDVTKVPASRAESTPAGSGGMQRPRYFCGQLLTEEDLDAEQRYQMEKNRLHNRYLHGWGVVCGLRVTCHRKCSSRGNVLIEKGYAIDCCGNDIIVPEDIELNVMDLIKKCEPKTAEEDCLPTGTTSQDICEGQEKQYCLAIRYKEEEARPVTALKRDSEGCSVKRCEPSRIKETYTFEVSRCKECYKTTEDIGLQLTRLVSLTRTDICEGTYFGHLSDCAAMYTEVVKFMGDNDLAGMLASGNYQSIREAYCNLREYVLNKIDEKVALVHCEYKKEVYDIQFPDEKAKDYKAQALAAFTSLLSVIVQIFIDCLCLHLQNPCPTCAEDDKVVLARVTVRGNSVTEICNLCRRHVISFPTLFYWLPLDKIMRQLVYKLCCEFNILDRYLDIPQVSYVIPNATFMAAQTGNLIFKNVMAGFTSKFKPGKGVPIGKVFKKKADFAKKALESDRITVDKTIRLDEVTDFNQNLEILKNTLFSPLIMKPDTRVDLYVNKDNEVIYAMPSKVDIGAGADAVRVLSEEIEGMKADLQSVRTTMSFARRDYDSTVKFKANIDDPLTIELAKALTDEMKPEVLKDIGDVRNEELRRARIDSVRKLFEATPADVSNVTKETDAIATKYINYAEAKALEVTAAVNNELKRAKVTNKKDLNKLDIRALARATELSQTKVRKILNAVGRAK